ncbi:MAG: metallophosphoesterase [Pseudomonadota bacterium]
MISDTHGGHEDLGILEGDVLIHCGDLEGPRSSGGEAFRDIDNWFGRQRFEVILCIGGNHDFDLEWHFKFDDQPFENAIWLHERSVTLKGLTFYGASWVPDLSRWAFFADDPALRAAWARIPSDVDVLVTHTPPAGVLDVSSAGRVLGCAQLARRLDHLSPQLHCFGHVHASSGSLTRAATTFANASSVNSQLEIARKPVVIDL